MRPWLVACVVVAGMVLTAEWWRWNRRREARRSHPVPRDASRRLLEEALG